MDLVPGLVSYVWFTPTRTGKFDIFVWSCAALRTIRCAAMSWSMSRTVRELAGPTNHLERHSGYPAGDAVAGQGNYMVCASCHGQQGEGNAAMNAPRLAGLPEWYVERQLHYYKIGARGAHKDDIYGQQMAPMAGVLADDLAVTNVSAYIAGLDATAASNTLGGDPARGARHYTSCGACHGAQAQGNYALQAPRLAGQDDWYLKRQLENFRSGVRGTHEADNYGHQMVLMARSLQNEQSIDDLMAYLATL